ncbi:PilZ domain-containing protein [Candidatus Nitrospira bockiana]
MVLISRAVQRFSVQLPVAFDGDTEGVGVIRDLSINGCRIASGTVLQPGAAVSLSLHPGDGPPIMIEVAEVRWATAWEFGVLFRTLEADAQERLLAFISTLPSA